MKTLKKAGAFEIDRLKSSVLIEIQALKQIREPSSHISTRIKAHSINFSSEFEKAISEILLLNQYLQNEDLLLMMDAIDVLKNKALCDLDEARSKWAEAMKDTYSGAAVNAEYLLVRSELHPQFDNAREKITTIARENKRKISERFKIQQIKFEDDLFAN